MADNEGLYKPPALVEPSEDTSFGKVKPITAKNITDNDIQSLPDRPNASLQYGGNAYSAKDLKERFEGLARLAINAINGLIGELGSDNVSEHIKIPEWGGAQTLKALVKAVQDGTLAKKITVTSVDKADTEAKEELGTLQDVLDYLTNYVATLEGDKKDGDLSKALTILDIGEGIDTLYELCEAIKDGRFCNYAKTFADGDDNPDNTITLYESLNNLYAASKALSEDLETFKKAVNDTVVYKPLSPVDNYEDLPENAVLGAVVNVRNASEVDGAYYPPGTNFLRVEGEDGTPVWDALGGMIDLSLVSQWDHVITDPTDLATKLATATGNVLVKLSQPYENLHYIQFNEGLKLIDFGGSCFRFTYFTANPKAKTVIKNIKTVITQEELWEGLGNGTLKNFGAVENCRGVLEYVNCSSVENCDIKYAESCNYIRNCSVPYSEYTTSAVFKDCCFINNVDVSNSEPVQNIEVHFDNCHHISNIHDDGAEHPDYPTLVYYDAFCTFVDPYTCAGYVSSAVANKVPVPDSQGGVEFKGVVEKINNTLKHAGLYAQMNGRNDPDATYLAPYSTGAYGKYIVQRDEKGNINAPNQLDVPPKDDQYISRRYLESIVGHIDSALDELHTYAHSLINGGATV